jgi:hypothetical protein
VGLAVLRVWESPSPLAKVDGSPGCAGEFADAAAGREHDPYRVDGRVEQVGGGKPAAQ